MVARVRKERDELLQKDAEAYQWAIDLLAELERERDLKLQAKERSMGQLPPGGSWNHGGPKARGRERLC